MDQTVRYNTAKKMYNEGKDVYVLPSNANPNSPWWSKARIIGDFDSFVNYYKFYNCNCETGYNLKYYLNY